MVSHDRVLLNLLSTMLELERKGIVLYGGNYDFYKEQKEIHLNALREQSRRNRKSYGWLKRLPRMRQNDSRNGKFGERSKV